MNPAAEVARIGPRSMLRIVLAVLPALFALAGLAPGFAQSEPFVHCAPPRDAREAALCRAWANDPAARASSLSRPPSAYLPYAPQCSEGRALRERRPFPPNMTDCEVLKAERDRVEREREDRRVKEANRYREMRQKQEEQRIKQASQVQARAGSRWR